MTKQRHLGCNSLSRPDIFLEAARRLGKEPQKCVVLLGQKDRRGQRTTKYTPCLDHLKFTWNCLNLAENLGSLIVGLKPNGVFAPKEYLSPCSSEILGTCVLLELLCDWWYFPPGQTTVLAIHQGLPFFFQAYPWWAKSLHHLDLITNYNCINPIFSSPCHLMIHHIYLLHWVGVDLNLNVYIYIHTMCASSLYPPKPWDTNTPH